jgi:hypothetical protein
MTIQLDPAWLQGRLRDIQAITDAALSRLDEGDRRGWLAAHLTVRQGFTGPSDSRAVAACAGRRR